MFLLFYIAEASTKDEWTVEHDFFREVVAYRQQKDPSYRCQVPCDFSQAGGTLKAASWKTTLR